MAFSLLIASSGCLSRYPSGTDGVDECLVVLLVLVGVTLGEGHERAVEGVATAQVRGDGDTVARPRVGTGQRGAAQLAEGPHAGRHHRLGFGDALPVPQLPYVEVTSATVDPLDPLPAEEDVTGGLHEPLTGDHALALRSVGAGAGEGRQHRLVGLLRLHEQRILVVPAEQEHDPAAGAHA